MSVATSNIIDRSYPKILALHINSTRPYIARHLDPKVYSIEDYDILTTILSALLWRELNGPIKLYTDSLGYSYYEKMGMLELWDGGIDVDVLDSLPNDIRYDIFWASSKLFAIRNEKTPFMMMDTDMLVWKPIGNLIADYKLAAFHEEDLMIDCYLPYNLLKHRPDYRPDKRWDWTVLPCNTALTYFNDPDFLQYYTNEAIYFMRGNTESPNELVSQMVFAEQRLFSMCADVMGIDVYKFLSYPEQEAGFTHIWGLKSIAYSDGHTRSHFCNTLCNAINQNFPEYQMSAPIKKIFDMYLDLEQ